MTQPSLANAEGRPVRIQRKRTKGWKMPENTVSVGRPSKFGNPFPVDVYGQDGAVDRFRRLMTGRMSTLEMSQSSRCDQWGSPPSILLTTVRRWIVSDLKDLRGKNLACWCALDQPCHADVLLELANPTAGAS
jgi:hypothetical protein